MTARSRMDAAFLDAMGDHAVSAARIDLLMEMVRATFDLPGEMPYDADGARARRLVAELAADPEAWRLYEEWRALRREEES